MGDQPDGAETKAMLPSGARSTKWLCCSLGASRSDANTMRTVYAGPQRRTGAPGPPLSERECGDIQ
jgi:hypothetical protein